MPTSLSCLAPASDLAASLALIRPRAPVANRDPIPPPAFLANLHTLTATKVVGGRTFLFHSLNSKNAFENFVSHTVTPNQFPILCHSLTHANFFGHPSDGETLQATADKPFRGPNRIATENAKRA